MLEAYLKFQYIAPFVAMALNDKPVKNENVQAPQNETMNFDHSVQGYKSVQFIFFVETNFLDTLNIL